jgi:geranylgeranyl pyrophosphate synthase
MKFVATYKPQLIEYLQKYLVEKEQESSSVILTPPNPYQKIIQFITSGKMVRGSLCIATYQLFKQDLPLELVRVASSLELFHAALLMHDDIMDESLTRHGSKSIHEQYKEWGGEQQLRNSARFGESVAQCIGDIMFFWAFDMLSDERTPHAIKHSFSHVLATTGLAQMQDMYYAMTTEPTPLSAVINMYKHKTAHYTFSLPLYAGAVLGGAPQEMLQKFQSLGELLVISFVLLDLLFQINKNNKGFF